jgi:tetratricopeptide (TPR) repeat protein
MFTARTYHRNAREAIWLALMAILAAVIMLMMGVKLAGASEPQPPRFLPALVAEWQEAVDQFRDRNFVEAGDRLQDIQHRVAPWMPIELPVDRGLALWNTLAAQARGQFEQAVSDWARTELPDDMRAWKHIAIAALYLERGRNDEAAEELAMAQMHEPDNAVVHYYLGMLHIRQADQAIEWPDYIQISNVRLVAYNPSIVPNTKGMYELAATSDLERAVASAGCLDRDAALIPEGWTTEPALRPTVADLLLAMGATEFEPNAHHMLGYLYIDRGALEVAEEHLDRTNELGVRAPFIFNELGELYEGEGRHADAARAYLKGVRNGPDRVGALMRFFQNAGDSVREGL